jgi:serine/threonine protein kinase
VLGVLGKGGFGTVYHARLEGADGFVKDVAIKLLTERDPGQETLYRFRDEARILGRVRDRGIVSVDPPSRLDGRWAVVMEYVDGIDCRRLVKEVGPLPPIVALGIVEEVARTLHNLWHHPGEDGHPIQLLHRDLKPSNVQVTPSGSVKLLDFGVARAEIGREWYTTNHIAGTLGYIAPERLKGVEAPEGDVYSLGVVLEELVTGRRPSADDDRQPAWDPVLQLAQEMRADDPGHRPTASEVERRCRDLQASTPGAQLREWAQVHVRQRPHQPVDDPLIGQTLSETFARFTESPIPVRRRKRRVLTGMALAGMLGLAVVLALGMIGGGVLGLWWWSQQPRTVAVVPIQPPEPATPPAGGADPVAPPPAPPAPKEPVIAPKPSPPEPPPPDPAIAQSGRVGQQGADAIELIGDAGRFGVGMIPAGTYKVTARFGGATVPAGEITIAPGEQLVLRCDSRFQRCMKP